MLKDGIDVRVTPSLDPEVFRSLEGYSEATAPFIADAFSAFTDAYYTVGKIFDARAAADSNEAWTEEQKLLMVGKEAAKQEDRLLGRMNLAVRTLEKGIAHIESELSKPLEARALGTLNQEIRGHAKGLDRKERSKLLNDALAAEDETTLASILGSPPFLSGLTAADHAHHLHQYHAKQSPHLVERLTLMKGAHAKVERDASKVTTALQKAVGAPAARVRAIDTANEAALAALRIEPTL